MAAAPFIVGALSQVPIVFVQRLLDRAFSKDLRAALRDGTANQYNLPPAFSELPLSRRITRDTDALSAVTYAASTLSAALGLLDKYSLAFNIALAIGFLMPVGALALLLATDPKQYWSACLFRNSFPITPFVYIAISVSLILAAVVTLVE